MITEFWYEQSDQQFLVLQSSKDGLEIPGELSRDQNHTWNFRMNLPFNPQSIVKIQSTLFEKSIHLLLRSQSDEKNPCIYPKSAIDFATCCHLCSTISSCPEIQIRPEHTRYDIIVTNRGLMVLRSTETFRQNYICSLFPTVDIRCLEFRV